jgi:hypothetical protein
VWDDAYQLATVREREEAPAVHHVGHVLFISPFFFLFPSLLPPLLEIPPNDLRR